MPIASAILIEWMPQRSAPGSISVLCIASVLPVRADLLSSFAVCGLSADNDSLARYHLPAAAIIADFLNSAECWNVLSWRDFNDAGLPFEHGSAVVDASNVPAFDDRAGRTRNRRSRRLHRARKFGRLRNCRSSMLVVGGACGPRALDGWFALGVA